jgi:ABC-type lipoprotein export system ATPase subunit
MLLMPPESKVVLTLANLCKAYPMEDTQVEVLKDINLTVQKGQFVAIYGPSGAGKTTLLNIIGGIDQPTSGTLTAFDQDLTTQTENALSAYRCNQLGFVFQAYNLISTLTVAENIAFPMEWKRTPPQEITKRVAALVETLGLGHRTNHFPANLAAANNNASPSHAP